VEAERGSGAYEMKLKPCSRRVKPSYPPKEIVDVIENINIASTCKYFVIQKKLINEHLSRICALMDNYILEIIVKRK
jgi:hypothetical protein